MLAVPISPEDHVQIISALEEWIRAKDEQAATARLAGKAQEGNRAAVTGGRHLRGVNQLIVDELANAGLDDLTLGFDRQAVLPGYYRASKAWDLLAMRDGKPVLTVEYKSMKGSEGKNLNNRADEVFGIAEDLRKAQDHDLVPRRLVRAYVFLMEVSPAVTQPVRASVNAGTVDPVFEGASYLDRMAIMCERLRDQGLYDLVWAVGVKTDPVELHEPRDSCGWEEFKAGLWELLGA